LKSNYAKWIGWGLSGLFSAFLLFSARGKFFDFEGKEEMFAQLGWSIEVMKTIGVVEVVLALVFLVPQTAVLGAILLTGYLGGAAATHVRVGEAFYFPILMGVVMWVALGLRKPEVFKFVFGCGCLEGGEKV
jgi:hypothetical protein